MLKQLTEMLRRGLSLVALETSDASSRKSRVDEPALLGELWEPTRMYEIYAAH